MICPNCGIAISLELYGGSSYPTSDTPISEDEGKDRYGGYGVAHGWCPECDQFIVVYREGIVKELTDNSYHFVGDTTDNIVYPHNASRSITAGEVPESYRNDFNEAASVLALSPKASAAISRRALQQVLRNEFHINQGSLAKEIEEFIHLRDVPSYISEAVDAVRNVGNFAAHPLKDTSTGEIVDVEPGEAEWLLEVLGSLFDFVFIQPKRLEARKRKLNEKLASLGKPEMKQPKNSG